MGGDLLSLIAPAALVVIVFETSRPATTHMADLELTGPGGASSTQTKKQHGRGHTTAVLNRAGRIRTVDLLTPSQAR